MRVQCFAKDYSIDPTDYNPNAPSDDICQGHAIAILPPLDRTSVGKRWDSCFLDISIANLNSIQAALAVQQVVEKYEVLE